MSRWTGTVSPSRIDLRRVGSSGAGLLVLIVVALVAVAMVKGAQARIAAGEANMGLAWIALAVVVGAVVILGIVFAGAALGLDSFRAGTRNGDGRSRVEQENDRWRAEQERIRAEREAREAEEAAVAAQAAAELLEAEPDHTKAAPLRSTDDRRDGKLIDAAGRFRSLGTFPVDGSTAVDPVPIDVDREA